MFTLYTLTLKQNKSEKQGYTSKFLTQETFDASNTKRGPKSLRCPKAEG